MQVLGCRSFVLGFRVLGLCSMKGYLTLWCAQLQTGADADADVPRG